MSATMTAGGRQMSRRVRVCGALLFAGCLSALSAATALATRAAQMPRPFDWPDPYLREVQSLRADRQKFQDQANSLLMRQRFKEAETLAAPGGFAAAFDALADLRGAADFFVFIC